MVNTIEVTHINVRQSIFFLIIKLIVTECLFSFIIVSLCFPLSYIDFTLNLGELLKSLQTILFLTLTTIKSAVEIFVMFSWLNEYYEVEKTKIIHRKGFIFRQEEVFDYNYVIRIGIQQTFFGKLFNYGTISLTERFTNTTYYLYLIHNPLGTFHIIEKLIPHIGEEQKKIREHIFEGEEGEDK